MGNPQRPHKNKDSAPLAAGTSIISETSSLVDSSVLKPQVVSLSSFTEPTSVLSPEVPSFPSIKSAVSSPAFDRYDNGRSVLELNSPKTLATDPKNLLFDNGIWDEIFGLIVGNEHQYESISVSPSAKIWTPAEQLIANDDRYSIDAFKQYESTYLSDSGYLDPYNYRDVSGLVPTSKKFHIRSMKKSDLPDVIIFQRSEIDYSVAQINSEIQKLFNPYISKMMLLFLRHVNPFFPVFSRGRFYNFAKQDTKVFASVLFAGLLIVTIDWWDRDPELSLILRPDVTKLIDMTIDQLMVELSNPCYGTIQACLLLTQIMGTDNQSSRIKELPLLSLAYSLSQAMGLNVNCLNWEIPNWEKRIRRRLWWTLFIQEKWMSFSLGKGSHISKSDWNVPMIMGSDFVYYPDPGVEEQHHTNEVKIFCITAELTLIVDEIADELLKVRSTKMSLATTYKKVYGFLTRIREFQKSHQSVLQINASESGATSCALCVAVITLKVALFRTLLHRILNWFQEKEADANKIPSLDESENDKLATEAMDDSKRLSAEILDVLSQLRPYHFERFWFSWSKPILTRPERMLTAEETPSITWTWYGSTAAFTALAISAIPAHPSTIQSASFLTSSNAQLAMRASTSSLGFVSSSFTASLVDNRPAQKGVSP
ncbi:hypothetical protein OGAPHI_004914 [Ogataea philodendri]|uniref:Xylanolytic transcriptional activator regulatory domain-containing protein n=1 Tax=Ogataea philodendri TaxID=1378263 RepID=A0A9P8T260_9ASCO|nr:uncharacterized protein OGAPHI_004914 [Ogataea philodendri]KAH3663513.1 hypothetical protein OGAPHI_004914 [Ogataea philodendri]